MNRRTDMVLYIDISETIFSSFFLSGLLARLAEHNSGSIDWSECLPVVFTRVQKMFSLPVHYCKINVGSKGALLDSSTAAKWITYTLGEFQC